MNETDQQPGSADDALLPSLTWRGLLLHPRASMVACREARQVPFTALWAVVSAAGILFYLMLSLYPREGFGMRDLLVSMVLAAPVVGLVGFRLAGWMLSQLAKLFRGEATTVQCQGALAVGLLPLGVSLVIALPLFVTTPPEAFAARIPIFALLQLVGSLWSLLNAVRAVSGISGMPALHAVVALMGMIGFLFAIGSLIGALFGA